MFLAARTKSGGQLISIPRAATAVGRRGLSKFFGNRGRVKGIHRGNAPERVHDVVLRELLARLKAGNVVDAPCGNGILSNRMSQVGFAVTGLDIVFPSAADDFTFLQADIGSTLPFADQSVDGVVSVEGIEHIEQPFKFVRECRRILRSNGLLVVTTPNISSLRSRWRWFLTGFHNKCKYALDETNPGPQHHINMLSYHEMRYLLHTNGFRIESVLTNRIKPINWLYLPAVPITYAISRAVIATAKDRDVNRKISGEVLREMTKPHLLFGEAMIVVARKLPE